MSVHVGQPWFNSTHNKDTKTDSSHSTQTINVVRIVAHGLTKEKLNRREWSVHDRTPARGCMYRGLLEAVIWDIGSERRSSVDFAPLEAYRRVRRLLTVKP